MIPNYSESFPLEDGLCYLNHAAVAPWPKQAADAVTQFAQENATQGATYYPQWMKIENQLRENLRKLINAQSIREIALLKNTSEALSVVAYGLDWQQGENIVTSNEEFPSNRIVWESLADQGVELRKADLKSATTPENALITLCDENTRLLTISSVEYASGLRLNLELLGDFCRANNILFCVDAIQSIGAVAFDVQAINADFVMADGHKWMLGPEGIALFCCRQDRLDQLKITQYGWHMVEDMGDYTSESWEIAKSARRFECGSPNMLGIQALNASIALLLEIGMDKVSELVQQNAQYLIDKIHAHPKLDLLSAEQPGRFAGIVTFKHREIEDQTLYHYLMRNKVICAPRGGGVRFSPHFYTSQQVMDRAFEVMDSYS